MHHKDAWLLLEHKAGVSRDTRRIRNEKLKGRATLEENKV